MGLVRLVIVILVAACALAQNGELSITTEHPRLFLNARRLRLLRREHERQSLRWNQFQLLMSGHAKMPEPGFAGALYYRVAGDSAAGSAAVDWATGAGTDLRQLALVFDWCQDLLSEAQSKALAGKLARGIEQSRRDSSVGAVRARLLAAVALAGHVPEAPDRVVNETVHQWWEGTVAPGLRAGRQPLPRDDSYALMEILHVIRDNLNIDMREAAPDFFHELPMVHLLSYYPATWEAPENQYRIPVAPHPGGEPDLRRAAISRAAELSMVAYDTNAPETQVLQGWLMNDNFLLRGTFGIPYEFMWANPYQPGLSYYHAPLVLHDEVFGRLFVRSSWDESAAWLGYFGGELQLFQDGRATEIDPRADRVPLPLTEALVLFGGRQQQFEVTTEADEPVFVVGLKPKWRYLVEVDNEEMTEVTTDPGGIMALDLPHAAKTGVRWRAGKN